MAPLILIVWWEKRKLFFQMIPSVKPTKRHECWRVPVRGQGVIDAKDRVLVLSRDGTSKHIGAAARRH